MRHLLLRNSAAHRPNDGGGRVHRAPALRRRALLSLSLHQTVAAKGSALPYLSADAKDQCEKAAAALSSSDRAAKR